MSFSFDATEVILLVIVEVRRLRMETNRYQVVYFEALALCHVVRYPGDCLRNPKHLGRGIRLTQSLHYLVLL